MSSPHTISRALALLRQMLGPQAQFRAGQLEAIEAVVERRGRALVVQRTGWGKSLVYFLATKLLREQGSGPALLVSPLLSLMRNQIEAAAKIGIRAFTINSSNVAEWEPAETALANDACDILMISPERLGNERFKKSQLTGLWKRIGLFVVDEAHCISDWGHDFRPDYRRLINLIDKLPPDVPVLGTTATANDRVIADIHAQLGAGLTILRGPLVRTSLRLQNIILPTQAERLVWLAQNIGKFKGSGVIYCLTVADVERVAAWLKSKGISAAAYHAGDDTRLDRAALEQSLLANEIKALVATVALGMGFDKPDLAFVIHFQRPGSVVAYYQQVGRAGRALDRAYGILLSGAEDDEIQDYFIQSAFPSSEVMNAIVQALSASGLTMNQLLAVINVSHSMAERALKLLEVEGAVTVEHNGKAARYRSAYRSWQPDEERARRITALREAEVAQMRAYVEYRGCLMEFLTRELDDPQARPCGVCANCQERGFSSEVEPEIVREAIAFLRGAEIIIQPRKRWPPGLFPELSSVIPEEMRNAEGRSLCYYGDAGWGRLVRDGKYKLGCFNHELVDAAVELIRERWQPSIKWVTAIPSPRHPELVYDFASRLAKSLGVPFEPALVRASQAPEQKLMANSSMQARNVAGTLQTIDRVPTGGVLLVDDIIDSGWTLALAGWLLRQKGSGVVHPFTLARATARRT